eukprot:m.56183 g.56183  ORF g.56183 m.56183 type:complete len:80 (+) comp11024_c0_seq1:111-350(+)
MSSPLVLFLRAAGERCVGAAKACVAAVEVPKCLINPKKAIDDEIQEHLSWDHYNTLEVVGLNSGLTQVRMIMKVHTCCY